MLLFCPTCYSALRIDTSSPTHTDVNRIHCRTCTYTLPLALPPANLSLNADPINSIVIFEKAEFTAKQVEDILGGQNRWQHADRTNVKCPVPRCDATLAYFYQVQIRSADEPMTTFYRCVKCGKRWKE